MIGWHENMHEIILPETKPETEWVRGRALQKMSPTWNHSRLQGALIFALIPWAEQRGQVGPEWRFRPAPPGEISRPLVPDVSYVRNERLRGLPPDELQSPRFAPDVAFEILSPGDRKADVEDKIAVYLAAGSMLVVLIDPRKRTVTTIDERERQTLNEGDTLRHPALPEFSLPLARLFAALRPPE